MAGGGLTTGAGWVVGAGGVEGTVHAVKTSTAQQMAEDKRTVGQDLRRPPFPAPVGNKQVVTSS